MKILKQNAAVAAALIVTSVLFAAPCRAADSAPLYQITDPTYKLTFSGMVACEGQALPGAEVNVTLSTPGHADMKFNTKTDANGVYMLTTSFVQSLNTAVDYSVRAHGDTCSAEPVEGRSILSDETEVRLAKSMDLNQRSTEVALR